MTRRTDAPFRADHVGSLLRPQHLLDARAQHAAGALTDEQLREVEDSAIEEAVRLQEKVGLSAVTDGEFRRTTWHMDFIYQLQGVHSTDEKTDVHFHNPGGDLEWTFDALAIDDKIGLDHTIFGDDFDFLKSVATTGVPKQTIPSPSMVHYRGGPASIDRSVYPDEEQFWDDLSVAYATELTALADLGCTYVQLDDTSLAYLNDPTQREQLTAKGGDALHQHERYIKQMNAALAGRPKDLRVTTHLCRGNFRSSWSAEGGYDFVAEALFGDLDVDGFFLEYDDARSGSFAPLRFVPPGKMVVLGLITSKRPELESKDEIKRRIDEAAAYVPLEQLCLSTQCGFSSTVHGNDLTEDQQIAKLELVVETAAEVWG